MDSPIVAIISVFNEEDIIGQVIDDLIRQRISVYVIDNGSTDRSQDEVARFIGRGVIGVERFPPDAGAETGPGRYEWHKILERKVQLAQTLDAAWFIHHDADEFRESPWADVDLCAAIQKVDDFGYNAIDFELLNFWPTHDGFKAGLDVREAFKYYEPGEVWNKVQIRCWKKTSFAVDLATTGGHEATFPNRKIFPIRFVLRHYPIRSRAHGERKVFKDRMPRFVEEERSRGWHVQYKRFENGESFVRDPSTLVPYDPDRVRLNLVLRHRGVEELEGLPETEVRLSAEAKRYAARLEHELDARNREAEALRCLVHEQNSALATLRPSLETMRERLAQLEHDLDARNQVFEQLERDLDRRNQTFAQLEQDLDRANREALALGADLDARNRRAIAFEAEAGHRQVALESEVATLREQIGRMKQSTSWRITKVLRRLDRLVKGQAFDE